MEIEKVKVECLDDQRISPVKDDGDWESESEMVCFTC